MSGNPHKRRGNQHPNIVPYQVFEASDGHVIVAAGNDVNTAASARSSEFRNWPPMSGSAQARSALPTGKN